MSGDTLGSKFARQMRMRERQRHDVPRHLFLGRYNTEWYAPPNHLGIDDYIPSLRGLLTTYPFITNPDPLVLNVFNYDKETVDRHVAWVIATSVHKALYYMTKYDEAEHTVDWWYRNPGQVKGTTLVAIRPIGLYELAQD